jgi:hypothetical protein
MTHIELFAVLLQALILAPMFLGVVYAYRILAGPGHSRRSVELPDDPLAQEHIKARQRVIKGTATTEKPSFFTQQYKTRCRELIGAAIFGLGMSMSIVIWAFYAGSDLHDYHPWLNVFQMPAIEIAALLFDQGAGVQSEAFIIAVQATLFCSLTLGLIYSYHIMTGATMRTIPPTCGSAPPSRR